MIAFKLQNHLKTFIVYIYKEIEHKYDNSLNRIALISPKKINKDPILLDEQSVFQQILLMCKKKKTKKKYVLLSIM